MPLIQLGDHFTPTLLGQLLPRVEGVAREAGLLLMSYYNEPGSAVRVDKSDGSPVCEADKASNDLIIPRLQKMAPGLPLVSEETEVDPAHISTDRGCWVVDPLDGTRRFLNRDGTFGVNIALVLNGLPVLGVVHFPKEGVTVSGAATRGARMTTYGPDGEPQRQELEPRPPLTGESPYYRRPPLNGIFNDRARSAVTSSSFLPNLSQASQLGVVAAVDTSGVSRITRIARGEVDFLYYVGREQFAGQSVTPPSWDIAAAHASLMELGGDIVTPEGHPVRYPNPAIQQHGTGYIALAHKELAPKITPISLRC